MINVSSLFAAITTVALLLRYDGRVLISQKDTGLCDNQSLNIPTTPQHCCITL